MGMVLGVGGRPASTWVRVGREELTVTVYGSSCPSRACKGTWHVSDCPVRLPSLGAVSQRPHTYLGSWPRSSARAGGAT